MAEHPAHTGHEYGGGYARAAALAEGDPDWMNATGGDQFEMLYCDTPRCRVNTFERGKRGFCPGCEESGLPLVPACGSSTLPDAPPRA